MDTRQDPRSRARWSVCSSGSDGHPPTRRGSRGPSAPPSASRRGKTSLAACPVEAGGGWGHPGATDQSVQQPDRLESLETNRRHRREDPLRAVLRDVEPAAQSRRDPTSGGCPANPRRPRHHVRGAAQADAAAPIAPRDPPMSLVVESRCRACGDRRAVGDVRIRELPRRKHFSTARTGSPPRVVCAVG